VTASSDELALWDLDEVDEPFSGNGKSVATVSKWSSTEILPTPLQNWPLPQRHGDAVFQIIPRTVGISVLSFKISASGPLCAYIRELSSLHRHYPRDVSFSRDALVFCIRDSYARGAPLSYSFILCYLAYTGRTIDDDYDHISFNSISCSIPFMSGRTYLDAFSSRVVFYDILHSCLDVGSFGQSRALG